MKVVAPEQTLIHFCAQAVVDLAQVWVQLQQLHDHLVEKRVVKKKNTEKKKKKNGKKNENTDTKRRNRVERNGIKKNDTKRCF